MHDEIPPPPRKSWPPAAITRHPVVSALIVAAVVAVVTVLIGARVTSTKAQHNEAEIDRVKDDVAHLKVDVDATGVDVARTDERVRMLEVQLERQHRDTTHRLDVIDACVRTACWRGRD